MDPIEVESEFSVSRVFRKVERGPFYLDESPSARGTAEDPKVFVANLVAEFAQVTGYGLTKKQAESLLFIFEVATSQHGRKRTFFKMIDLTDISPGFASISFQFSRPEDADAKLWSFVSYDQHLFIARGGGISKIGKGGVSRKGNKLAWDFDFWGKK